MNFIDFLIGLTLVNSLPHISLGIWKGRMLSGLGVGNVQNIIYGILNLVISLSLYLYQYGWGGIKENEMYLGGLFVAVMYLILGKPLYNYYHKRYYDSRPDQNAQ